MAAMARWSATPEDCRSKERCSPSKVHSPLNSISFKDGGLMSTNRIAIIGTGRVGYQFSFSDLPDNHAAAIVQHPSCELVAGVNRGREKLDAFGERFNVEALYHDYRQMLAEVQPDICIVATHPELHAEMVTNCAQATSTRAIICEKPMALSLEECDQMIAACQAEDVLLQ
ncbi:MAG: Gfo/Idh/MocA family oxidoreductase, partial [Gemmatimonadetes bacterium]|nr:Gfo/Idh/MocA family oxidoreductase [Gemmatimonadota bacterium]